MSKRLPTRTTLGVGARNVKCNFFRRVSAGQPLKRVALSELEFKEEAQPFGELELLRRVDRPGFEVVGIVRPEARAVDRRSTRLVINSYLWGCGARGSSTSFNRARNATLARSCCDICTVVRGGIVNSVR